jgi:hypothetical protein
MSSVLPLIAQSKAMHILRPLVTMTESDPDEFVPLGVVPLCFLPCVALIVTRRLKSLPDSP